CGNETVLYVGTGSGVLSIAASFLGAKEIYAYDLDEVAVKAAKENLALNPTATNIWIKSNDLLKGVEHKADVIVANILADIIVKMIPDAWRLLKDDVTLDRKSTRLNASHVSISYAVFCLKKKKIK